jgi:hypothetical protein
MPGIGFLLSMGGVARAQVDGSIGQIRSVPHSPEGRRCKSPGQAGPTGCGGATFARRTFGDAHLVCFAPLPKDRVSVPSNSSYAVAALTDDSLSAALSTLPATVSTASDTWLCTVSLVFATTS